MKITKQDVEVWVKASDEFPNVKGYYITKRPTINENDFIVREEVYNPKYDDIKERWIWFKYQWLKPVKDVYVLTEDELEEFALEFTEHLTDAIVETKPDSNLNSEEIYKQFLESIKNKL